jgi:hypothetical protein
MVYSSSVKIRFAQSMNKWRIVAATLAVAAHALERPGRCDGNLLSAIGWNNSRFLVEKQPIHRGCRILPSLARAYGTTFVNDYTDAAGQNKFERR